MKKITFSFSIAVVFLCGCQIMSSDETTSPAINIEPFPIQTGQEIEITISSSKEFIMPFCDGITYELEKLESESWIVFDGHYGPCNGMMKPETFISKSFSINYTINEEGIYRIVSAYKFDSDDEMKPLYSEEFEVKSNQ